VINSPPRNLDLLAAAATLSSHGTVNLEAMDMGVVRG
jgi:hypothetical protein